MTWPVLGCSVLCVCFVAFNQLDPHINCVIGSSKSNSMLLTKELASWVQGWVAQLTVNSPKCDLMASKQHCKSAIRGINMLHSYRFDSETCWCPCWRQLLTDLSMAPVKTRGLELAVALSLFHTRGSVVLPSLRCLMVLTVGKITGVVDLDLDQDF